jgi:hypothetical protein
MNSLATELPKEQARVRELKDIYMTIPMGFLAANMMEKALQRADQAVMSGDVLEMLKSYKELKGFEK